MMNKVQIDKMRDILIIEKTDGDVFLKGANVFCGCCGESIGTMSRDLTMPFFPEAFLDSLDNKSVEWMLWGLMHKTCRHSMFPFEKSFNFITLENYLKSVAKAEDHAFTSREEQDEESD